MCGSNRRKYLYQIAASTIDKDECGAITLPVAYVNCEENQDE